MIKEIREFLAGKGRVMFWGLMLAAAVFFGGANAVMATGGYPSCQGLAVQMAHDVAVCSYHHTCPTDKLAGQVNVPLAGYYSLEALADFNSGDEQMNETFYLKVENADGTIQDASDGNAGPYFVVEDHGGPAKVVNKFAGTFYFDQGVNKIYSNHYVLIFNSYPQFLNGSMGPAESVSLRALCLTYVPEDEPSINLTKDGPETAVPGQEITYSLNWSVEDNSVTNLTLSDPIPELTSFVSASDGGAYDGGTNSVTWNLGNRDAGDSGSVSLILKINDYTYDDDQIVNVAALDSDETDEVEASKTTLMDAYCELRIVKIDDIDPVAPGGSITYTIEYENIGNAVCVGSGTIVRDTYDPRTTFVSANPTPDVGNYEWHAGDLMPDGPHFIEVTVVVDEDVQDGEVLENLVCTKAKNSTKVCDSETTTVRIPVEPYFNLSVDKQADENEVLVGQELSYTIDWSVTGNMDALNVLITDSLPEGVSYVSATGDHSSTTDQVFWNLGTVTPDDSGSFSLVVRVDEMPQTEEITNYVIIESGDQSDDDSLVTDVLDYNFTITKTAPSQISQGAQITYDIEWSMSGNTTTADVVLMDFLPEGLIMPITSTPAYDNDLVVMGTKYGLAVHTLVWYLGDVAPGDFGTIEIVAETSDLVKVNDELENTARIYDDNRFAEDSATSVVTAVPYFDLSIDKSSLSDVVAVGQELSYTIDWSVTGNMDALNVLITDSLPEGVSYVSATGDHSSTTDQVFWNLGTVTPDDSGSFSLVVRVDEMPQAEEITNYVIIESGDQSDDDSLVTPVVPAPDFDVLITKSGVTQINPGGEIVYTINWEVTGDPSVTAPSVTITDFLPDSVTYTGATDPKVYDSVAHSVTWSLGDITPGTNSSGSVGLAVLVSDTLPDLYEITNNVDIDSGGKHATDSAVTVVSVDDYVALNIDKSADKTSVEVGDQLNYTIDYEILGTTDALGVVITDTLPAEVEFVSASNGGSHDDTTGTVSWNLGDITPGSLEATGSLTIVVNVLAMPDSGNEITNHVLMTENGGESDEDTEITQVTQTVFDYTLEIEKSATAEIEPGEDITYTINWWVSGNMTAPSVEIVDSLPSGVSFISASDGGSHDGAGTVSWTLTNVAPGTSGSYTIVVSSSDGLEDGDQLVNNVVMTSGDKEVSDSATTSVSDGIIISVCTTNCGGGGFTPNPRVSIDYDYPLLKTVGDEYLETITVTNTGNVVLTNGVLVIDFPEEYIQFISSDAFGYIFDPVSQSVSWSIPALAVGDSYSVSVVIKPLQAGSAVMSDVSYESDQADNATDGAEEIVEGLIPPPPPVPEPTPEPTPEPRPAPVVIAPAAVVAPVVEGECEVCPQAEVCQGCSWWLWLIVILIHALGMLVYWFYVSKEEIKESEDGEYRIIKGNWAWSLPVLFILVVIFLLLIFVCHIVPWWALALILAAYYLALVFHQLLLKKAEIKYSPMLPILATVAVLVAYFLCNSWTWWVWLIVIVLYVLSLASYYLMVVKMDAKSRNYWWLVVFFMTVLIVALEMVLRLCQCQEVIR